MFQYDLGFLPLYKWLGFGAVNAVLFVVVYFTIGPLWWCTVLGKCASEMDIAEVSQPAAAAIVGNFTA